MFRRALAFHAVLVLLLVGAVNTVAAQDASTAPSAAGTRLRVYLEACDCFEPFLRDEIMWVDFVRQPQDADLQVLGSAARTGAGAWSGRCGSWGQAGTQAPTFPCGR